MSDDSFSAVLDDAFSTPASDAADAVADAAPAEPESVPAKPVPSEPAAEPAADEADPEPAPEPESVPAEPVPSEPVVEDPAEAALNLTPEELADIKSNPATAKLYKSLMRASTAKFQEISADKKVLQAMRENPRAVIEAAARNMGLTVADPKDIATPPAQEKVVDSVMDDMVNLFGPELAPTIRPVMERMVKSLVEREVEPIKAKNAEDAKKAQEAQSKAHADTFRAKHPDLTPEVEAKIMSIGKTVFPAEGTNPGEYLEMLYTLATAGNTARATAKVAAERIKVAQKTAEPRRGGAPVVAPKQSLITEDMTLDQAFDAAWAASKSELSQ